MASYLSHILYIQLLQLTSFLPVISAPSPPVLSVLVTGGPGAVAVTGPLPAPAEAAATRNCSLNLPRHLLLGSTVPPPLGDREKQPVTLLSLLGSNNIPLREGLLPLSLPSLIG